MLSARRSQGTPFAPIPARSPRIQPSASPGDAAPRPRSRNSPSGNRTAWETQTRSAGAHAAGLQRASEVTLKHRKQVRFTSAG